MRVGLVWCGLILCPVVALSAGPPSPPASARQADRVRDLRVRDVSGRALAPFSTGTRASVVIFVATDCPVSNAYAPVIQGLCREYASRGVGCSLMYEDVETSPSPRVLDDQVRAHLDAYKYAAMPAAIDRDRSASTAAEATITPTAVIVDRAGELRYRGRIDNLYAALGKTRQVVTSHDLRDALDAVLAGRAVQRPDTEAIGCFITDPALLRKHTHE